MDELLKEGFLKRVKSQLIKNKSVEYQGHYIMEFVNKFPEQESKINSILSEVGLTSQYKTFLTTQKKNKNKPI